MATTTENAASTGALTAVAAAALEGPEWLRSRRVAAAERAETMDLPSVEEELWRYSRIEDLDPSLWAAPEGTTTPAVPEAVDDLLESLPERAGTVVVVDGVVARLQLDPELAAAGLELGRLAEADDASALLGSVAGEPEDVFGWLNEAFAADPVLLRVPDAMTVEAPIVVVDWAGPGVASKFLASRLLVVVGADSEVSVVEWHGGDAAGAFAVPMTEIDVGAASRVRYTNIQDRGPEVTQIAGHASRVGSQATFRAAQAALGGDWCRTRTDCQLTGQGAHGELGAVYFGEATQSLDFRTTQRHLAPDTTSDLRYYGAVSAQSQAIYTGTIYIAPSGRGSEAHQTNRNLKLSEGAWADSVPNLEIENNDVQCSHASTVGPVDADQLFYLQSRGVPTAAAEQLIVSGFFSDALARMPEPAVADLIRAAIAERLQRRQS